jgi:hypothetical protein
MGKGYWLPQGYNACACPNSADLGLHFEKGGTSKHSSIERALKSILQDMFIKLSKKQV